MQQVPGRAQPQAPAPGLVGAEHTEHTAPGQRKAHQFQGQLAQDVYFQLLNFNPHHVRQWSQNLLYWND